MTIGVAAGRAGRRGGVRRGAGRRTAGTRRHRRLCRRRAGRAGPAAIPDHPARGGVTALDLPASWRDARAWRRSFPAVPTAPNPTQFLARPGPITGHRLPNQPGADGRPLNRMALDLMAEGARRQAIDAVLRIPNGTRPDRAARAEQGWAWATARARRDDLGAFQRQASSRAAASSIYARGVPMSWADWPGQARDRGRHPAMVAAGAGAARRHPRPRDRGRGGADHRPRPPRLAGLNRRATAVCLGAEIWRDGR